MGVLKLQSNGPLYSSTVIGARMGCYIWYSEEVPGWSAAPRSPLLAVLNVTHQQPVYQFHII